jgi:hypothetical protein
MGGSSSRAENDVHTYYKELVRASNTMGNTEACKNATASGGYAGTSGSMVGGIDDLTEEYDTTVSSKAKRDLIKKLSDGISKALKVTPPGSNASSDELVSHLMSIVPNPRKGKSVIANKEKQGKLCQDVADVINKNYGRIIDTSLGPEGICNQVSDIVESLSAGLNQEYVAVAASVERSLSNLQDLKEMLDRSYNKLYSESSNSEDGELKYNIVGIKSIHDLLMQEVQRQLAILSNLTRTNLHETQRDISKLLSENDDFKGLVASITSQVGTSEWGDKLGFWLSGVNNVAQIASRVDKALKTIGMKASDYKQASKLSDMMLKTHELMEKMPSDKLTRDYIDKYEEAVEILKKHHGHHSDISNKIKGAYQKMMHVGGSSHEYDRNYDGGVASLTKKLHVQQKTRILLLKDFKTKMTILMDRIYKSIFIAGKRMGSGHIKLSDDVYRFKTTLDDLVIIFKEGIEYALTGYYTHANAVQHKDRFLGLLTSMLHVLDSLKSSDESFRDISLNIEAAVKLIDFFNDKFMVHTGHTAPDRSGASGGGKYSDKFAEVSAKASEVAKKIPGLLNSAAENIDNVNTGVSNVSASIRKTGSGNMYDLSHETSGGGEFKAVVTLQNAKNTFAHFYAVAKFKINLKTASGELKRYDEKYTSIVGSAVGKELSKIKQAYNEEIENLCKGGGVGSSGYKSDIDIINDAGVREKIGLTNNEPGGLGGMGKEREWDVDNIKELLLSQVNAKEKLYRVAQAVDEYLQKFTNAVSASPDDIQEVGKLLGTVEIMADWFNEKSGDSIASLYEIFPWTMVGMRTFMNKGLQERTCGKNTSGSHMRTHISPSSHYYKGIVDTQNQARLMNMADYAAENSKGMPGVPFFPISPARAIYAKHFAKYTIDKIYVLKNIVSAFTYLGKKFGGEDLTQGTFMSPNDMYKCLSEYLYTSAFVNGWDTTQNNMRLYGLKINGEPYGPPMTYNYNPAHGNRDNDLVASPGNVRIQTGPYMPARYSSVVGAEWDGVALGAPPSAQESIEPSLIGDDNWPVANSVDALRAVAKVRHKYSWAMSCIDDTSIESEYSISGWKNVFKKEDALFVNIIKSMAAKVFTVTGLYNMLNFGDQFKAYSLSPTRLILGGGKEGGDSYTYDMPKIYPEAIALYARLPLLAEFYRDVFCFEEPCEDDTDDVGDRENNVSKHMLISMVPEVGSLWSGFIQTIFEQPINTNGLYTDNVLKRLIHEINGIYQTYKSKGGDLISTVIADFIAEINGRYGLMNRGEIIKYTQDEKLRKTSDAYGNEYGQDPTDFDILDSDNMGTGVAPSDRYVNVQNLSSTYGDHELDPKMYNALKIFRRRIDKRIADVMLKEKSDPDGKRDQFDKNHFVENIPDFGRLIMSTQDTLKTIESVDERYKTVSSMMIGMDVQTQTDADASIMFHESVVTPLAVLTTITTMLTNYQEHVRKWNAPALYRSLVKGLLSTDANRILSVNAGLFDNNNLGPDNDRLRPWVLKNRGIVEDDVDSTMRNLMRNENENIPAGFMGRVAVNTTTNVLIEGYRDAAAAAAALINLPVFADGSAPPSGWKVANHVAYLLIRWEALFKNITRAVSGLTADLGSLCDVQFTNGRLIIDHTKLQMVCEEVFATVRKNMDKFRGVIDDNRIQRYEMNANNGSVSWVQQHMFDELFGDQDRESGLKRAHQMVTESYLMLSNRNPDGGIMSYFGAKEYSPGPWTKEMIRTQGWCVDGVLSELTHYHSSTMSSRDSNGTDNEASHAVRVAAGVAAAAAAAGVAAAAAVPIEPIINFGVVESLKGVLMSDSLFHHLMHTDLSASGGNRDIENQWAARHDYYLQNSASGTKNPGFRGDNNSTNDAERIPYNEESVYDFNNTGKIDIGAGLMMRFNEVMAQYISQFWDQTSLKIYSPLLEVPANGPMNQEVFKMQGWPDVVSIVGGDKDRRDKLLDHMKTLHAAADGGSALLRIGSLINDNIVTEGFSGLPLDLTIPIKGEGNDTKFDVSTVDVFSMYVKMAHGDSATLLTTGGKIARIAEMGVDMQQKYQNSIAEATWSRGCTVTRAYNFILANDLRTDYFPAMMGNYTTAEAIAILTPLASLYSGGFAPNTRVDNMNVYYIPRLNYIVNALYASQNAAAASVTIINIMRAVTFNYNGVPNTVIGAVGAPTPATDVDRIVTLLYGLMNKGVNGAPAAQIPVLAINDVIPDTNLTKGAMHGQVLRRLFNIKRKVISRLKTITNRDLNWKREFTTFIKLSLNTEVERYETQETNRLKWVTTNAGLHPISIKVKTLRLPPGDDTIKNKVDVRTKIVKDVLQDYINILIEEADNNESTVYSVAAAATICVEPLTATWKESCVGWSDLVVANVPEMAGTNLYGSLNTFVTETNKWNTNKVLATLGAEPGRLDTIWQNRTAADTRAAVFNTVSRVYRHDLTGNAALHNNLRDVAVFNRAGFTYADTIFAPNPAVWNNPTANIISILAGAGISNIAGNDAPSSVDVIDSVQINVLASGFNAINGTIDAAAGGKVMDNVLNYASNMWRNSSDTSKNLNSDDIPKPSESGLGDPTHILFASLSKAINTALTEVNRTGVKMNVVQSIAEVPLRMKEAMKGQLPIFNEMFKMITKNANTLKGLIKLGIGCCRIANDAPNIILPVNNVHGGVTGIDMRDENTGRQWYISFLDKITNASETMSTTIESVINELNDAPLYLEVNENSIVEYKNRYSKLPFMPLSSLTMCLQPSHKVNSNEKWPLAAMGDLAINTHPRRDPNLGYPGTSSGDPLFMYNYGSRLLLHDYKSKPSIDHMPGVKDIITKYNLVAQGQKKIDEKTYGQYSSKIVELLRYVHATRLYSTLVNGDRRIFDDSFNDQKNTYKHMTYQMTQVLPTVIELTTGSDCVANVATVVEFINGKGNANNISRNSSIIYNILDLNISPINIHAMRREIPLINLYNYAHTFDSFVTDIVQSSYIGQGGQDHTLGANDGLHTHDVLAGLCKNPYIRVPRDVWYGKLVDVVSGVGSLDLYGYPKFISDQLWGKALLQNTVVGDAAAGVVRRKDRRFVQAPPAAAAPAVPGNVLSMLYQDSKGSVTAATTEGVAGAVANGRSYISELGRLRFDTKFARNLMFLANVQRIMLHKINTETVNIPYPVASGVSLTNRKITDYRDGETYSNLSID